MKYALIGKTGKVVQTFKTEDKAKSVLIRLNEPNAKIIEVHPAVVQGIETAGKIRRYRPSTIARIIECIEAGKASPRYSLTLDGVLLTYTASEEDARFLRSKARGFCKRVLQRKFNFRIVKLERQLSLAAS